MGMMLRFGSLGSGGRSEWSSPSFMCIEVGPLSLADPPAMNSPSLRGLTPFSVARRLPDPEAPSGVQMTSCERLVKRSGFTTGRSGPSSRAGRSC
jgi:hypothetical protein